MLVDSRYPIDAVRPLQLLAHWTKPESYRLFIIIGLFELLVLAKIELLAVEEASLNGITIEHPALQSINRLMTCQHHLLHRPLTNHSPATQTAG